MFKSLVGSHNYNLTTETSDKDYKEFLLPDFNCLYNNTMVSKKTELKTKDKNNELIDIEYHDIRKLNSLLLKANISYLEILYSSEEHEVNEFYRDEYEELMAIKKDIVKMNLRDLYKSVMGTVSNRRKLMLKGTESTQELVDKYGYDCKQFMHAVRTLDFLRRFQNTGFNDFEKAIRYKLPEERDWLLSLKNGALTLEEAYALLDRQEAVTKMYCEKTYLEKQIDMNTKDKLEDIVRRIVKKTITKEIDERYNCNHCIWSHLDDGPYGSYNMICYLIESINCYKAVDSDTICKLYELD